MDVRFQTLKDL